jgi:hypothetical protein
MEFLRVGRDADGIGTGENVERCKRRRSRERVDFDASNFFAFLLLRKTVPNLVTLAPFFLRSGSFDLSQDRDNRGLDSSR